jgi:Region found in RelA / SpoT proteins
LDERPILGENILDNSALSWTDDGADMAEWVKREYGKGEIDRAGNLLVPWWKGGQQPDHLGSLYMIVQNWRTSHGLPLNVFQAGLRQRTTRMGGNVIVAQRLKRFSSLMNKLVRESSMKLSQMQDLGGCRAIVSTVDVVDKLYAMYRDGGGLLFEPEGPLKCYDYIRHPKPDGYRGVHVVGRYRARAKTREPWNGHRIEIQLRSRLQHAFATTVETVTTFTRTPLKFGAGPTEWRVFFSLVGSAFALRERTPLVDGTPSNEHELIDALSDAAKALKVHQRLQGWTHALRVLPGRSTQQFKWLLLVLDTSKNTINVTGYGNRAEASRTIAEIEQSRSANLDAVLVWVNSIRQLRAAYPNYYADTGQFLNALDVALAHK